jgi:NADPH2:quinone reductase
MGLGAIRAQAVVVEAPGGPEVLALREVEVAAPGPGEVRIRHTAIGLNYIDTYFRTGLYPLPLPFTPGVEGAGVVEAVGEGVEGLREGDRVAYCWGPPGGYATHRLLPADHVVRLPEGISDELAAAALLKGCTAEYLIERCARVEEGQWVLLHAAAGGVGQIAAQWLAAIGARAIGTVSSEAKAAMAREAGCEAVVRYDGGRDWVAEVRELTGGEGVAVVIDGVGAATFDGSLRCLRRRGLMISYGAASGPVPPFETGLLGRMGSLFLTRPSLFDYCFTRAEKMASADRVFGLLEAGVLSARIDQRFALAEAAEAHRELKSRTTTGSTLLLP